MTESKKLSLHKKVGYGEQWGPVRLKRLLIGGLAGVAGAVLLTLIFSVLLALTDIPDGLTSVFTYATVAVSALIAGFTALRLIKADGLVNGLIAGGVLFLIHIIAGMIFGEGDMAKFLIYGAVELPLGALGGVISVNLKK